MFFGHLTEVLGLLVLGLLIFGPKRMIELGGQLGRTLREVQSAMKEMNWNPLGDDSSTGSPSTALSKLSQLAQNLSQRGDDPAPATPPKAVDVVEVVPQASNDTPAE
jgi:sec-independent protein translocase protein TatA